MTQSNKINDFQRRFARRVEHKELPSLQEWLIKQQKLHEEIQQKIAKCSGLYEKYKHSGHKSPIDSSVFQRFERLRELYSQPFAPDTAHLAKVKQLLNQIS